MSENISILVIGSEILEGRVLDTNSHHLADRLRQLGFPVDNVLSCDDSLTAISEALEFLFKKSRVVIASGGLGPTTDDLTREAIAKILGLELECSQTALEELKALYHQRKRRFEAVNEKQACFPKGAQIFKNSAGIAPAFAVSCQMAGKPRVVCALPGVPVELKAIFEEAVIPLLKREFGERQALHRKVMRIFGKSEAAVGEAIQAVKLDPAVRVAYCIAFPEVQVLLSSEGQAELLEREFAKAKAAVGESYVFSENLEQGLENIVHHLLCEKEQSLALAESCTGGMIGGLLTSNPGASDYFLGSVVSYANEVKTELLGVEEAALKEHGAVSPQIAAYMARGARAVLEADLALSVTGIAGPSGGSADKPVGTFFVGLATPEETGSFGYFFAGSRERVRRYIAFAALDILRRYLLALEQR